MTDLHALQSSGRFSTCLHGRVLARGRSYPVTITVLSHDGLIAEGSEVEAILGPFTLEVAVESSADAAWNPKALGPQFLHLFSALAERAEETGPGKLAARFTEVPAQSQRLLETYLAQLAGGRDARAAGGVMPRPPLGPSDGG